MLDSSMEIIRISTQEICSSQEATGTEYHQERLNQLVAEQLTLCMNAVLRIGTRELDEKAKLNWSVQISGACPKATKVLKEVLWSEHRVRAKEIELSEGEKAYRVDCELPEPYTKTSDKSAAFRLSWSPSAADSYERPKEYHGIYFC